MNWIACTNTEVTIIEIPKTSSPVVYTDGVEELLEAVITATTTQPTPITRKFTPSKWWRWNFFFRNMQT